MILRPIRSFRFEAEQGTAAVIIALTLTVLAGITALVLDAGFLYWQKTRLSNACDAAALAAIQDLPRSETEAIACAKHFVLLNFPSLEENIAVAISEDKQEITVQAQHRQPLFFARVLGQEEGVVKAQATARIEGIGSILGAAPLSIGDQAFILGEEYHLKDSPGDFYDPYHRSGWYGPLALGGNGANCYLDNLINGYQAELQIGDVIETETGNMSGPTSWGIAYRILACNHVPRCSFNQFSPDCSRLLLVPVVEPVNLNDNQISQVKIVGFAAFFIENFVSSGNENYLTGRFVKMVASGKVTGQPTEYGLFTTRLVR